MPWILQEDGTDNFASLRNLDWQAHVYGEASAETQQACAKYGLSLERFLWSAAASRAGFARNAFYLVRPDGYLGLAAAGDIVAELQDYQARFNIAFAKAQSAGARSLEGYY